MTAYRIHKTRGTSRCVVVEAATLEIVAGCLVFRDYGGAVTMAYSPWAWKTVWQEGQQERPEGGSRG